ncbi:MAG: D-aminoacyl-tRNA deacylase [Ignavibacteria bacterium]|jgi:D-tyrosyl-tRNA(Tyr) deacylase
MIAVVQRVSNSSVEIEGSIISKISLGLLILLGIKKGDNKSNAEYLLKKVLNLRIFPDDKGKMNLSVKDTNGEILVVSQFTLCTDNNKSGNRPSFTLAEEPIKANELYEYFINKLKEEYVEERILSGVFSSNMKLNILNDGPVTILLEK